MKLWKVFSAAMLIAMTWAYAPMTISAQALNPGLNPGQLNPPAATPGGAGQAPAATQPAQQPAAAPSAPAAAAAPAGGHLIAVVDMGRIFKEHPRFKAEIQQLESDGKHMEGQMKAEFERISAATKQFKADPKAPDSRQKEADIARQQTDFEIKRTQTGRDLQTRESKMFLKFYVEIDEIVKQVASRNNIAVVLRYNNIEINPQDRNDIMRGIGKPILYAHPTLDITQLVFSQVPTVAAQPGNTLSR